MLRLAPRQLWPLPLAAALFVLVALTGRAHAHALVDATSPEADEVVERSPDRVVMEFNEPVEINFGAIRVFDTNAQRVDAGATEYLEGRNDAIHVPLRSALPGGTYTVAWRVISADGHPIEEAFVFHVGRPGARPEGIGAQILRGRPGAGTAEALGFGVVRSFNFAALLVLAGAFFFRPLVWSRKRDEAMASAAEEEFTRRQVAIMRWSWFALIAGTVMSFIFQGAIATERSLLDSLSAEVVDAVAGTRFGRVALVRLGLLAVAGIAWMLVKPRQRLSEARSVGAAGRGGALDTSVMGAGTVLLIALLATPGLAGHAGTTPPVALNVAVDALHMIAGAAWIGGLAVLLTAGLPASRRLESGDRVRLVAPMVSRFSNMAVIAVAVIVITGTYASVVQVGGLSVLFEAPYGILLVAKIAIVLPLLALGGVNKLWIKPRLERVAQGEDGRNPISLFRRIVTAEVLLAVAVIGVTAFLVNAPPARNVLAAQGAVERRIEINGEPYVVTVRPNRVGSNTVEILPAGMHEGMQMDDANDTGHGDLVDPAVAPKEVTILFRMPAEGIGPLPVTAREVATGHFVVQGHQLSVPGRWVLEIVARIDRFEEERVEVAFEVNP